MSEMLACRLQTMQLSSKTPMCHKVRFEPTVHKVRFEPTVHKVRFEIPVVEDATYKRPTVTPMLQKRFVVPNLDNLPTFTTMVVSKTPNIDKPVPVRPARKTKTKTKHKEPSAEMKAKVSAIRSKMARKREREGGRFVGFKWYLTTAATGRKDDAPIDL